MRDDNNPEDTRNLIIALVLSMGVLMLWQMFFMPDPPKQEPTQQTTSESGTPGSKGTAPGDVSAGSAGAAAKSEATREDAVKANPRVAIETPSLIGSINLEGGRIDDLTLVKYREAVEKDSPQVVLFSPAKSPNPYFAEHGWAAAPGSGVKAPNSSTLWSAVEGSTKLTPSNPVKLTWDNGAGLVFHRTISVDDDYLFQIEDSVINSSGKAVTLYPYGLVYRYGIPKTEGFWISHEGMIGWIGAERLKEVDYSAVVEPGGSERYENVSGGWVGFTSKYWAAALVPDQSVPYTANMKLASAATGASKNAFQADFLSQAVVVGPNETKNFRSRLFAGAKQFRLIEEYQNDEGILQFDYLIDWGWFDFITYPLHILIDWFNYLFGNFGLAVLACTVVVKLAFFPLANKAYQSMARMKALQPKVEELKLRHGEDKQALQKSMMELYQKEKINPLAGCLPILLQIPVFFALYKVLFVSIDMRHAPFFGWIRDLSAPDPTSIFNLFGLLPFGVPDYLMIGVWPLLMGLTMWLQMQLNPPQPDPAQQMVFNWMPVLFTFLLAKFPAGLVIYWAWNNLLSIAQQWYIMRRQGVDVPIVENIKKTVAVVSGLWPGNSNGKPKA